MATIVRTLDVNKIVEDYVGGTSENALSKMHGVDRGVIRRRLVAAGVTIRGGSEAEKLKWSQMSKAKKRKQVASAHAARRGQKDGASTLAKRAIQRMVNLSHIGVDEVALANALLRLGVATTPQKAIGPYNLDLAIEEPAIAIEIEAGGTFYSKRPRLLKRIKYLIDSGWIVLYIVTCGKKLAVYECASKIVALFKLASGNKTTVGHYGMLTSKGKPRSGSKSQFNDFTRIPGF